MFFTKTSQHKALIVISMILKVSTISAEILPDNIWSRVKSPLGQVSQAIGSYANGCQIGAETLEASGRGFISIRRFRHRFYSQPVTLDLIHHVGRRIDELHQQRILVGDLSLPIGGKMPYGHSSHQTGLDVDFWFYTLAKDSVLDKDIAPPTMVDMRNGLLFTSRWKVAYRDALYAAATYPQTARIFVNPVIKRYLCGSESDTTWLHKLRPWWGHDAHFHVRLHCPVSSPDCQSQAPIPAGDGCHQGLDNWISKQREAILNPTPTKPKQPKPEKVKPVACQKLLQQADTLFLDLM